MHLSSNGGLLGVFLRIAGVFLRISAYFFRDCILAELPIYFLKLHLSNMR